MKNWDFWVPFLQYFYGFDSPREVGELTPYQFYNYIEQVPEILEEVYGDESGSGVDRSKIRRSHAAGKSKGLI